MSRAQWFNPFGKCDACHKTAAGILMSDRNDSLGPRCERCAKHEIKQAHKSGRFLPDAALPPEKTP